MLITCNSPSNDADSATDSDGAAKTNATAGEEKPSCLGFSLKQQWQKIPLFAICLLQKLKTYQQYTTKVMTKKD